MAQCITIPVTQTTRTLYKIFLMNFACYQNGHHLLVRIHLNRLIGIIYLPVTLLLMIEKFLQEIHNDPYKIRGAHRFNTEEQWLTTHEQLDQYVKQLMQRDYKLFIEYLPLLRGYDRAFWLKQPLHPCDCPLSQATQFRPSSTTTVKPLDSIALDNCQSVSPPLNF